MHRCTWPLGCYRRASALLWCCPRAPLVTAALLSAARASDYRIPPARRRRCQSHSVSARSSPARVSSASVLCHASGFASCQRLGSVSRQRFCVPPVVLSPVAVLSFALCSPPPARAVSYAFLSRCFGCTRFAPVEHAVLSVVRVLSVIC